MRFARFCDQTAATENIPRHAARASCVSIIRQRAATSSHQSSTDESALSASLGSVGTMRPHSKIMAWRESGKIRWACCSTKMTAISPAPAPARCTMTAGTCSVRTARPTMPEIRSENKAPDPSHAQSTKLWHCTSIAQWFQKAHDFRWQEHQRQVRRAAAPGVARPTPMRCQSGVTCRKPNYMEGGASHPIAPAAVTTWRQRQRLRHVCTRATVAHQKSNE